MSQIPDNLKYAASHEWVLVGQGDATVGITDHAQEELTDVVFVELPEVGRKITAGEAVAVVESVKTASDIYSPVAGEVIEINPKVVDDPSLVNSSPYGDGWFFKVKLDGDADTSSLMDSTAYKVQIGA